MQEYGAKKLHGTNSQLKNSFCLNLTLRDPYNVGKPCKHPYFMTKKLWLKFSRDPGPISNSKLAVFIT